MFARPLRLLPLGLSVLATTALFGSRAAAQDCRERTFDVLERDAYRLRDLHVVGPFVPAEAYREEVLAPAGLRAGQPIPPGGIEAGKEALRERLAATPALFEPIVAITIVVPHIVACDDAAKLLDLEYRVLSSKIPGAFGRVFESREEAQRDPVAELGLGRTPIRFRFAPRLAYDRSIGTAGGATASLAVPRWFDRLEADVLASSSATNADLTIGASYESSRALLAAIDWRLGYHHADRPTDRETLKERAFVTQVTTVSQPLGSIGALLRIASLFEVGDQRTALPAESLPPGYVATAGFGGWRNAIGVDVGSRRHGLTAAYGLQFGFTRDGEAIDYVKQLVDLGYAGRVAWRGGWSHRPLEIVVRGTFGRLDGDGNIPAPERFFGGGVETPFLANPSWQIRGNPVLRSFPANWLNRYGASGAAIGADRFASSNMTVSLPIWSRPLVPAEVDQDADVREQVDAALTSGEALLAERALLKDPIYPDVLKSMLALRPLLGDFETRLRAIVPMLSGTRLEQATACLELTGDVIADLQSKTPPSPIQFLEKPSQEGDRPLPAFVTACLDGVARDVNDGALTTTGNSILAQRGTLSALVAKIDRQRALTYARREMTFPRNAVATIFDEMNLWSVGPALIFDAARISTREPQPTHATRYGVGVGVRLTLASTLQVTSGYVWNTNREQGEPRGAGFVTLTVAPLFTR